jgi:hypothetical protein
VQVREVGYLCANDGDTGTNLAVNDNKIRASMRKTGKETYGPVEGARGEESIGLD